MPPLEQCLTLSALIFSIGLVGFLVRRNIIVMLMCVELMLNGVNLSFVAFSRALDSVHGQVFSVFVITIAAAEAATGLAILIALYRNRDTINSDEVALMRG